MSKNISIIGGSGFLGLNLSREFHRRGFNIMIYDLKKPKLNLKFKSHSYTQPKAARVWRGINMATHKKTHHTATLATFVFSSRLQGSQGSRQSPAPAGQQQPN